MQLGAGGNGEVWEALDEDTGEVAAISGLLWRDGYSRVAVSSANADLRTCLLTGQTLRRSR
jgi:hypothetical protein